MTEDMSIVQRGQVYVGGSSNVNVLTESQTNRAFDGTIREVRTLLITFKKNVQLN